MYAPGILSLAFTHTFGSIQKDVFVIRISLYLTLLVIKDKVFATAEFSQYLPMHAPFDQVQSPLHHVAPYPREQSEHVAAICPPQLTMEADSKIIEIIFEM